MAFHVGKQTEQACGESGSGSPRSSSCHAGSAVRSRIAPHQCPDFASRASWIRSSGKFVRSRRPKLPAHPSCRVVAHPAGAITFGPHANGTGTSLLPPSCTDDPLLAKRHGVSFRLPELSDWRYFSASQPSNSAHSASVSTRKSVAGEIRLATSASPRIIANAPALACRATNTPLQGKINNNLEVCSKSRAVSPARPKAIASLRKIT